MLKHRNRFLEKKRKYLKRKKKCNIKVKNNMNSSQPRLLVKRSNLYNYIQILDEKGNVLVQNSDIKDKKSPQTESAKNVWLTVASKALEKWIKKVVFDRNWYIYHGRIAKMAEWAREGGLEF